MISKTLFLASLAILTILIVSSSIVYFASPSSPMLSSAQATKQSTLSPTDDAYVIADLNDPTDVEGLRVLNTGTASFLKVWYAWNITVPGTEKIVSLAYLKFNLAPLHAKNITSAQLDLYAIIVNLTGVSRVLTAYYVSNNSWSESTLDFDNAPAFTNTSYAQTSVSAENQWYTFDLTNMAQQQMNGELSIAIAFQLLYEHNQEQVVFNSNRATSDQPKLVVNYIGPSSSGGIGGVLSSIVSFVSTSPWIYIVPAVVVAGGGSGAFFFFYSRRSRYKYKGLRRPRLSEQTQPSVSMESAVLTGESASLASGAVVGSSVAKSEVSMMSCPSCGKQIQSDFSLCPYCGFELPTQCPKCGKAVKKDFAICPYCGAKLASRK